MELTTFDIPNTTIAKAREDISNLWAFFWGEDILPKISNDQSCKVNASGMDQNCNGFARHPAKVDIFVGLPGKTHK